AYIKIRAARNSDATSIEIEDNGEGIRAEYQPNIFNMFYRASENTKGSGLGLYIAKETVNRIGGNIAFQSEYGKGSVFTIEVPELK
ncbi:MAG TPA: sensor histidine kinase, partial [Cyclobacteriaceae bacterium]|nr:sensor histidine kinase [Cyclobacteriaceae bacterium]